MERLLNLPEGGEMYVFTMLTSLIAKSMNKEGVTNFCLSQCKNSVLQKTSTKSKLVVVKLNPLDHLFCFADLIL